jgi:hypothetical protein
MKVLVSELSESRACHKFVKAAGQILRQIAKAGSQRWCVFGMKRRAVFPAGKLSKIRQFRGFPTLVGLHRRALWWRKTACQAATRRET